MLTVSDNCYMTLTILPAADSIGTVEGKTANPLTGAWFRMEQGPSVTPPTYEYNEIGIMVKGTYLVYTFWHKLTYGFLYLRGDEFHG